MKLPSPKKIKLDPGAGLLKRIRSLMATEEEVQERLNNFVKVIASSMRVNVVSVYLRSGDTLVLCATKGLNQSAVHETRLALTEGLVGQVARTARILNTAEAPEHRNFSFKPETGEKKLQSFLGVPLLRGGRNLGVLVVQNKKAREFSEAEVENLLTAATLLAEIAVEDERAGGPDAHIKGIRLTPSKPENILGTSFAAGLARGHAYLHLQPVGVGKMISTDIVKEEARLEDAILNLRASVDAMVSGETAKLTRASREIFESYRMFAYDRKWLERLREAVRLGLTAEAAVERVRNEYRARMLKARDAYLRARLHDLEDLANRMLRILSAEKPGKRKLPENAVVFARNLGPAEILDYDHESLAGIVLEEGAATAHATIICRTLGIPLVGLADGVLDRVEPGDEVLVDGEFGGVYIRPIASEISNFNLRVSLRSDIFKAYQAQRDILAKTLDGQQVKLMLNAGLLVDLPLLKSLGADGIGLFRTELQFMIAASMPKLSEQVELYRAAIVAAGDKPVTFRTLDLGGDKLLPYSDVLPEENPAIGWRAIRIGLDRPGLLRYQCRALLIAGAGRHLRLMFPMVATVDEFLAARDYLNLEIERRVKLGLDMPTKLEVGVMLETPALAWQVDAICEYAEFVSIGANDLMQFFFAADRNNPRVASRFDPLHPAALSLLAHIAKRCKINGVPVSVCGELAGSPLDAVALVAAGYDSLSMPVTGIGPVKAALLKLDAKKLAGRIEPLLVSGTRRASLRTEVQNFCESTGIPV